MHRASRGLLSGRLILYRLRGVGVCVGGFGFPLILGKVQAPPWGRGVNSFGWVGAGVVRACVRAWVGCC